MSRPVSALSALMPVPLQSRTFFVRCRPVPRNFTERRAVLKTIQGVTQNDVEVFKKLKDNSSFIVVTTKVESTKTAIHDSPYERIVLTENQLDSDTPKRATWGALYDVRSTITNPIRPIPAQSAQSPPQESTDGSDILQRTLTIHCFPPNKDFNHDDLVEQDTLNGPWPDSGGFETYISASLRQTVPSGHMAPGLRDWETGRQMTRDSSGFADEGVYGAAATILGKPKMREGMGHVLERARLRKQQGTIPEVMKGLAAYAKKAQEARNAELSTVEIDNIAGDTPVGNAESRSEGSDEPQTST